MLKVLRSSTQSSTTPLSKQILGGKLLLVLKHTIKMKPKKKKKHTIKITFLPSNNNMPLIIFYENIIYITFL